MSASELLTKPARDALDAALLSVEQVAKLCNCSTRHIYRLADAGRMPAPIRLGSLVRWSRAAIDEWFAAGCKSVRQPGKGA